MPEFEAIGKLMEELGISALFTPLLATIIIFYLLRKYVLAGAGEFLRSITAEYLKQQHERIAIETKIDLRLSELSVSIDRFVAQIIVNEKRYADLIESIKRDLSDRLSVMGVDIGELRDALIEHEAKVDSRPCIMQGREKYQIDTETFRKKREGEANK